MMGLFIGRKGVDISQAQWSEALNNPFWRELCHELSKQRWKQKPNGKCPSFAKLQNNNNNLDKA